MIATIFLEKLRQLKPQTEIAFFQEAYNVPIIEPRQNSYNNEIENLCLNYLDEDIVLGIVTIFSTIRLHDGYKNYVKKNKIKN